MCSLNKPIILVVIFAVLGLAACASLPGPEAAMPTKNKQGAPVTKGQPAVFMSEIKQNYPGLAQELLRLPDVKDGINKYELVALRRLSIFSKN